MSTPDRWERVQELFEGASALAGEERSSFLDDACEGEPELRREVESLLRADEAAEAGLEEAVGGAVRVWADDQSRIGRRIGAYDVTRELGHGGMGTVYLGVRADDEYRKEVAVKLIRGGVDDEDARRRFLAERQILADLDHENIARLLDGGTTEDGVPYVVMERVEGLPIDEYCDRHRLIVPERLRLFRRVCDAVQFAHRNLIVHRDLKPSNILVTEEGIPKLLDFGVAKLLDAPSEAATTMHGARLTPEYASPEQISGEAITTASDVYSLGVLLYRLLTDRWPYRLKQRTPREMTRAVTAQEPVRPSAALSTRGEGGSPSEAVGSGEASPELAAGRVAADRGTTPKRLRRQLLGDLDTIVLMALRKEPERRYASVELFSEDLRRYLDRLPVMAQPDTAGYRVRRFAGRHRGGVTATAAVVVLLTALTAFHITRLASERDRALAAEEEASLEAQTAREVSDFLTGIFRVSVPGAAGDGEITARQVLDEAYLRIEDELSSRPTVRARMMNVLGGVYGSMDVLDRSRSLLEEALALRIELFGEEHLEVADSYMQMGHLLYSQGDFNDAEAHYERARAVRTALLGPEAQAVAAPLRGIGAVRHYRGDLEGAEQHYLQAHEILTATLGREHPDVVASSETLAGVAGNRGRTDEAEARFLETLELARAVFGERHLRVASIMSDLAVLNRGKGDFEAAEPYYLESLAIRRSAFAGDHTLIAQSMNNYGLFLRVTERFEEAEPLLVEAVEMNRRLLGPEHPTVGTNLNNLAALYLDTDRLAQAERTYAEAYGIQLAAMGPDYWVTRVLESNWAETLIRVGRGEEGERRLLAAHASLSESMREGFIHTRTAAGRLASYYESTGRMEEAEHFRRLAEVEGS